ncbi:uncharacterized protein LOC129598171 [Paramacrobiotus metropolitanus]|uniref:uncharacterized protein LOC129598171 n=1 Tax=Paramacrobiotus metropolitanus TaxID=2943436 RepID=UPI002445E8A2|nr:uncharacterized protein LOC129598171 [Paramacrobiotus metropolitanus]XP_055351918.1 uncharacterized protein LOC129598171 [Paramacrobiotus metropolitanus]
MDAEFEYQVGLEPWPYRRCGRSVSSGNTVMVRQKKAWYLGFIEDIADDQQQIFVNFHCASVPAAWLPARQVFPHALPSETYDDFSTVLAARRADPTAPLLFQRADVVAVCHTGPLMCCVQTTAAGPRHLLHPLQIAVERPPRRTVLQPPASPHEGVYAAYTTAAVDVAHINCIDENRLQFEMKRALYAAQCRAVSAPSMRRPITDELRYYMRLGRDSVKFIIWQRQEEACIWSVELLSECVRHCLQKGVLANDNAVPWYGCPNGDAVSHNDVGSGLAGLPLEIIENLLELLDVVTRTRLQRVSRAWTDLAARNLWLRRHFIVDFGLRVRSANKSDEMHRLGRLLYHGLSRDVRTLVLRRWRPADFSLGSSAYSYGAVDLTVMRQVIRMRQLPAGLQRIIYHRCVVSHDLPATWSRLSGATADHPAFFPLNHLSPLMDVCSSSGQVIVVDYVQKDAVRPWEWLRPFRRREGSPYSERSPNTAPPLSVALPFLRLDCRQDAVSLLASMRTAMETALPEPPAEMRRMATDMYEYWRTRDTYWHFLRHLLTATEPGGPVWQHADFPNTPLPQLTRLTVFALDSLWCRCSSEPMLL